MCNLCIGRHSLLRYCCTDRSEEHTSELQSLTNLVCRLLLEKKKKNKRAGDKISGVNPTHIVRTHSHFHICKTKFKLVRLWIERPRLWTMLRQNESRLKITC